jgi:hypothetical protein
MAVLMFAVATLAFLSYKQTRDIAAIRKDVVGFAESVPKNGSLELQGKCAEQSRKFFQEAGYTPKDLAQYEDHYNPKLNKCFVLFESTDAKTTPGVIWTNRDLYDAFEGKNVRSICLAYRER